MMPAQIRNLQLSKIIAEVTAMKEQFYRYVEDGIYNNYPDCEYKTYAIAYLHKARAALQEQDALEALNAKEKAQKIFDEAKKALESVEQVEGQVSAEQLHFTNAEIALQQASLQAEQAKTLAEASALKFQESWAATPKGTLENNLMAAQSAQQNAQANEEAAKLKLDHFRSTTPHSEQLADLEEKYKTAQDEHNKCKLDVSEKNLALQNTLTDFEKDYYAKLEQERVVAFEQNLSEFKENTSKLLNASTAYEEFNEAVFNNQLTVYQLEQRIELLEEKLAPVLRILESLAHPGPFFANQVVTRALRSSNDSFGVANFIIDEIVATGVISKADANARMLGTFSTSHNSSSRFNTLVKDVSDHWNKLQDDYKTNYLMLQNTLRSELKEGKSNLAKVQQTLTGFEQQLSATRESIKALLSPEQYSDFSKSEAITQQQFSEQFWQANHSPEGVKNTLVLVGQLGYAHHLAHDMSLQYSPNFEDKNTSETISKMLVEYKYHFLPPPGRVEKATEIADLAAQLARGGVTLRKITNARDRIDTAIATSLLENSNNIAASTLSENITTALQRGLGIGGTASATPLMLGEDSLETSLTAALEVGNQRDAQNAIQSILQTYSKDISTNQIGEWQNQPLAARSFPDYTGKNEKHGFTRFWHKPIERTLEIFDEIQKHRDPGASKDFLRGDSNGIYGGLPGGYMHPLYQFNKPTQVLFEIPKPPARTVPVINMDVSPKNLSSEPLPSVLSSKPWEAQPLTPAVVLPGQFSVVPLHTTTASRAPEPVLPLSTYLPSLATPSAPMYTPLRVVSSPQSVNSAAVQSDTTLAEVTQALRKTRSGAVYGRVAAVLNNKPEFDLLATAQATQLPKEPESVLSKVAEDLVDSVIGKAEAHPLALPILSAAEGGVLGARGGRDADNDEVPWLAEYRGWGEPKEQSTSLPAHVEDLAKYFGHKPEEQRLMDIEGGMAPHPDRQRQSTETTLRQPGIDHAPYTTPANLKTLPLFMYSMLKDGIAENRVDRIVRETDRAKLDFTEKLTSDSLNKLAQPVDQDLIKKLEQKGWTVVVVENGSDERRYLDRIGSDASINSAVPKHIIIKPEATKSALLEEFLHGTQNQLGLVNKYGDHQALEVHVKDFMLRHVQLLGLNNTHDIRLLEQLKLEEISRLRPR